MKDISEAVGLSRVTVSNVLNGKTRGVWTNSQARVDKIKKVAEEMGYRPNSMARATRMGRTNKISMLSVKRFSWISSVLNSAVIESCNRHGFHYLADYVDIEDLENEDYLPRFMSEWVVDGILLNCAGVTPQHMLKVIADERIPTIWFNEKRERDTVYPDDFGASEEITRRIAELGHRDIAFVETLNPGTRVLHYSRIDRRAGYETAMAAYRLKPRSWELVNQTGWPDSDPGTKQPFEECLSLLLSKPRPTALVCYSVSEAMRFLAAALSLGIKVPEELSIVSFRETFCEELGIPMSLMTVDLGVLADAALDALTAKINFSGTSILSRAFSYKFHEGATLGPPSI